MKIAFMTGLSSWNNNKLSPIQETFLNNLKTEEKNKIYLNFPFIDKNQVYKKPHIILASISNACQYFLSKTIWIKKHQKELRELLKTEKVLLLLVGSCGLEILRNMDLSTMDRNKIHVITYGGVAKKTPDYKYITLVQGDKDWISRLWIKEYDLIIQSDHMNYLESEELLNFTNQYIEKLENL